MKRYDPLTPPDSKEWLARDENDRLKLVADYHRRAGIRLPNAKLHAVMHAIVETQFALGDETPVRRTVQRLMSEGLDRHDAIHAVGSVLADHIMDILGGPEPDPGVDPNVAYFAELERLTAEAWLRST
jgi:hypothetical protein